MRENEISISMQTLACSKEYKGAEIKSLHLSIFKKQSENALFVYVKQIKNCCHLNFFLDNKDNNQKHHWNAILVLEQDFLNAFLTHL